jgi:hypothetical protein
MSTDGNRLVKFGEKSGELGASHEKEGAPQT